MAKALKRRALAEYSSQTSVVEQPVEVSVIKRLKLKDNGKGTEGGSVLEEEINNLDTTITSAENFRTISKIVSHLAGSSNNSTVESLLFSKLKSLLVKDGNPALRAKCLACMKLLKSNISEVLVAIEDVLLKETSSLVIVSGLNVAANMSEGGDKNFCDRVFVLAKKLISSTDATIKCKCLQLIAILAGGGDLAFLDTVRFVHSYCHSSEPRVRSVAFKTLLRLHGKGAKMDVGIYLDVSKYLDDDHESVRLAVIQLIWAISQACHDQLVPMRNCPGETMRLIDDAFAKTCHAINDPCVQVRVLAATLLGKMPQVGQSFLDQTLDKKLMSDMRRKKSAHERQWEKVKSGEWSSGKKWADDAPQEVVDADSVTLISSGAAGAFVHGLEDEFMEVRSASVDSLCALALKSPEFSNLALDFLVDMFNDEIEEVRLKAIDSLTKISQHIVLWEDQLETILGALEDSSIDIREGLHKLLAVCHLMTKDCVQMVLEALLDNLKKYSHDKKSIWKCLQGIGMHHPWVVLPLVPQLLSMHPFFDTSEPDPEDPAYVSVLILVFNAAKGCNTMSTLFDEKLLRHYHYLRDTLPTLVPELNMGKDAGNIVQIAGPSIAAAGSGSSGLLKELITKYKNGQTLGSEMKQRLSKLILKDLKRISEVDQEVSSVAKFTALYIRAHLVYSNCIDSKSWAQLSQNSQNESLKVQIRSFMQLCLKMQYGFSGLSSKESVLIMQLKLRALALRLVYIVRGSNASALASCQFLLQQAEQLQQYMKDIGIETPDEFCTAVFQMLDKFVDPKPGSVAKLLLPLFEKHSIQLVAFTSPIKMTSATIIEPTGESDTPLKFTAGLLLGISFEAEFCDIVNTANVRIQVKYPDQQIQLICPRPTDFRPDGQGQTRLLTTIKVSHQAWTEPCPISIGVVLDLSGPETNYHKQLVEKNDPTYIVMLSEEKQVSVVPKVAKRGI